MKAVDSEFNACLARFYGLPRLPLFMSNLGKLDDYSWFMFFKAKKLNNTIFFHWYLSFAVGLFKKNSIITYKINLGKNKPKLWLKLRKLSLKVHFRPFNFVFNKNDRVFRKIHVKIDQYQALLLFNIDTFGYIFLPKS